MAMGEMEEKGEGKNRGRLTTQKKQKKSKSRRSNLSFFIDAYRVGS
jgi:hypothetical protein